MSEWADDFGWRVECEVVRQLLTGHFWRYENDDVEIIDVERTFELPLVNPQTGRASRAFALAGKIDAIVRLADGRLYASQRERDETPEQYGVRLLHDIGVRPDYYFQRREVPHLEDELAEFQIELWQQAKQLLDSRRHGRWFRNVHRFTCGTCEFADICLNSVHVTPGAAPAGYELLANVHPELATGDSA
ncbi:MAG: hypothetical protein KAY37_16240 [Phycisphaerae bacterium]|nr:hypothetical protein [Phycisphaerae bacterium]